MYLRCESGNAGVVAMLWVVRRFDFLGGIVRCFLAFWEKTGLCCATSSSPYSFTARFRAFLIVGCQVMRDDADSFSFSLSGILKNWFLVGNADIEAVLVDGGDCCVRSSSLLFCFELGNFVMYCVASGDPHFMGKR